MRIYTNVLKIPGNLENMWNYKNANSKKISFLKKTWIDLEFESS